MDKQEKESDSNISSINTMTLFLYIQAGVTDDHYQMQLTQHSDDHYQQLLMQTHEGITHLFRWQSSLGHITRGMNEGPDICVCVCECLQSPSKYRMRADLDDHRHNIAG